MKFIDFLLLKASDMSVNTTRGKPHTFSMIYLCNSPQATLRRGDGSDSTSRWLSPAEDLVQSSAVARGDLWRLQRRWCWRRRLSEQRIKWKWHPRFKISITPLPGHDKVAALRLGGRRVKTRTWTLNIKPRGSQALNCWERIVPRRRTPWIQIAHHRLEVGRKGGNLPTEIFYIVISSTAFE